MLDQYMDLGRDEGVPDSLKRYEMRNMFGSLGSDLGPPEQVARG